MSMLTHVGGTAPDHICGALPEINTESGAGSAVVDGGADSTRGETGSRTGSGRMHGKWGRGWVRVACAGKRGRGQVRVACAGNGIEDGCGSHAQKRR
eukprot:364912-Chlamydomonas_euryale.AAC.10